MSVATRGNQTQRSQSTFLGCCSASTSEKLNDELLGRIYSLEWMTSVCVSNQKRIDEVWPVSAPPKRCCNPVSSTYIPSSLVAAASGECIVGAHANAMWTIRRRDGPNRLGIAVRQLVAPHFTRAISPSASATSQPSLLLERHVVSVLRLCSWLTEDSRAVRDPATWTMFQPDGPNHLGWC